MKFLLVCFLLLYSSLSIASGHSNQARRIVETVAYKHRNGPTFKESSNKKYTLRRVTERVPEPRSRNVLVRESLFRLPSGHKNPDRKIVREFTVSEDASILHAITLFDSNVSKNVISVPSSSPHFQQLSKELQLATKIFSLSKSEINAARKQVVGAQVPAVTTNQPGDRIIPQSVVNEVSRVVLTTFALLGVNVDPYKKGVIPEDLVDINKTNKKGLSNYPRYSSLGKERDNMVVVVILSSGLRNRDGEEIIAVTGDGVIAINLKRIDSAFAGANKFTLEEKVGIVLVEEAIHHVQMKHWGMSHVGGATEDLAAADLGEKHDLDEKEAHAGWQRKPIVKVLYPDIPISSRGIDFRYE